MENSEQGKYDKIKKTIFYGEGLPSKDEGRLDYALTHAFNYLKEETVFDADLVEKLIWKRVEEYAILAVEALEKGAQKWKDTAQQYEKDLASKDKEIAELKAQLKSCEQALDQTGKI